MDAFDPSMVALLVIDVQVAFDEIEAEGARRNNPDAVGAIARLLDAFREAGRPVLHVRHASTEAGSRFRPDRPGHAVKHEARERAGEPVIVKSVNSAFIRTDLETRLRQAGITTLVITGATTNHCVETTTRMAGNLGFDARLVSDATWTFDRTGPNGRIFPAELVQAMTEANLAGEFAAIVRTEEVIGAIGP